jgi:hypothetical protein
MTWISCSTIQAVHTWPSIGNSEYNS